MPTGRGFLRTIDRQVPKGLQIRMILDNYGTHTHDNVVAWLDKHPRFQPHFIPTSRSWLNVVERWFRELTEKAGGTKAISGMRSTVDSHPHDDTV